MKQPTTTLVLVPKLALVPKLQLGNPESEALASQDRKLELPGLSSQAGAWERAEIPPSPPFSKGGEYRSSALATIDSSPTRYANASENQGLPNTTNEIQNTTNAIKNTTNVIPSLENPATSVPPFEKGGLGGNTVVVKFFKTQR